MHWVGEDVRGDLERVRILPEGSVEIVAAPPGLLRLWIPFLRPL